MVGSIYSPGQPIHSAFHDHLLKIEEERKRIEAERQWADVERRVAEEERRVAAEERCNF